MTTDTLELNGTVLPVTDEQKTARGDFYTPPAEPGSEPKAEEVVENPMKDEPAKDEPAKDEPAKGEPAKDDKKDEPEGEKDDRPRDANGKFLPVMIPKARFDEVRRKSNDTITALKQRIQDLETRHAPEGGKAPDVKTLEADVVTKTGEYTKLVADGELDKANVVMTDILALNRRIGSLEASELASKYSREQQNVNAIHDLVDLFKAEYPVFDDKSDVYNQDYVDYVAGLQDRFERTGSSPAEALQEAVELAITKFGLVGASDTPETPEDPKAKAEGERTKEARKTAAKVAAAQPPALQGGLDSDKAGKSKFRLEDLSYEQIDKLMNDETAWKALRGDNRV